MNQNEIVQVIMDERKRRGINREDLEKKAGGVYTGFLEVIRGTQKTIGILQVIKFLEALDMELVVRDKKKEKVAKSLPSVLFVGERIESRKIIASDGFFPRIDCFETAEGVLRFVTKPCDVYEISTDKLDQSKFTYTQHPYGLMYSYSGEIGPDIIGSRYMYK